MVTSAGNHKFLRQQDGVSIIEGLLVFPLIILTISAFVEFGFAVFQWNQAVKALQIGARMASVSDPLVENLSDITREFPRQHGGPVPSPAQGVSCGARAAPCAPGQMERLIFGSDGICNADFGTSMPGICDFNAHIQPENIRITYSLSGLGFVGRPEGIIVTITLELKDLSFHLPLMGSLLGFDNVTLPQHAVSALSEDLSSCGSRCN